MSVFTLSWQPQSSICLFLPVCTSRFIRTSSLFSIIVLYSSFYFVSLHDFRIIICFTVVFLMECEKTVKRNVEQ